MKPEEQLKIEWAISPIVIERIGRENIPAILDRVVTKAFSLPVWAPGKTIEEHVFHGGLCWVCALDYRKDGSLKAFIGRKKEIILHPYSESNGA